MEFWGVEVKSGQVLSVEPGQRRILHLSQANIGDLKKEKVSESINLYVNVDGKKLVLATLNTEKLPQQQFDLIFDTSFELSHNWKNGSVFFIGYMAHDEAEDESGDDSDSDSEFSDDDLFPNNGVLTEKPSMDMGEKKGALKEYGSGKQKVKAPAPAPEPKKQQQKAEKKQQKDEDEDESSDDDEEMEDDSEASGSEEDDEDESDSEEDDSEDEETPKKVVLEKKRPAEASKKIPVPEKKVKLTTPQKTDGKKGTEHVATPHPSKKAGKTPQTPKSGGGSVSCKECNRNFGSEGALDSHSKAKHSAGK